MHDHSDHTGMDKTPQPASADPGAHEQHAIDAPPGSGDAHAGHAATTDSGHQEHGGMAHDMSDPEMAAAMVRDIRRRFFVALAFTILTVLYSPIGQDFLNISLPEPVPANWMMLILSTPVVFWSGWIFINGAYHALRWLTLDMSVLIATGVLAAYISSVILLLMGNEEVFFDAATMLVTFVLFGHWMEMKSRRGTSDALRALFDLIPPTAVVIRNGAEVTVPAAEIVVDDTVMLRPGDKIPVDGEILTGATSVDEALVTGESLPVDKKVGSEVIGGSINRSGTVTFRATKVGADTALAQIVLLVRTAQNSKAPGQRLADKAAQYLVVLAVGSGLLTFAIWYGIAQASFAMALTFAISAVVIACPDALGLATPTVVAVGTGIAARHYILIKDAATLEGLSSADAVMLDKTGTLTEGAPSLDQVIVLEPWSESSLLAIAASAEYGSEHPLSRAVVAGAAVRQIAVPPAEEFQAIAGHGVQATVGGRPVLLGNAKLMLDSGIDVADLVEQAAVFAAQGRTPIYVAIDNQIAGIVVVSDAIKPNAAKTVAGLTDLGLEVVMVTGDNRLTAATVGNDLGIERVFAEVLPGEKASYVEQLQKEGKRVAMVGDGVNDAPALAQANIGIAIGAGSDVAIETAQVVLMRSDPADILRGLTLSRATVRKMKENLVWASVYNVLAIPIAAGALYPAYGIQLQPEWAALLMSLSSIIVATNAILLRRIEPKLAGWVIEANACGRAFPGHQKG